MKIQIIIKNPSVNVGDFKIEMELFNTIKELKIELSERYPSKPKVEQQKLIFAGKLLKNDSTISEVLNQYDEKVTQTFHLVISKMVPTSTQSSTNQIGNFQANLTRFPIENNQQPFQPMNFQQFQNNNFQPPVVQHQQFNVHPENDQQNFNQNQENQPRDGSLYLFLKLVVFVYILSAGASLTRTIVLGIAASIIFLYQTGRLRVVANIRNVQVANENNNNAEIVNENNRVQQQQQQQQQVSRGFIGEIIGILLPFFFIVYYQLGIHK